MIIVRRLIQGRKNATKVMCNVYNKVGQTYYGFQRPSIRVDRRPGRPRQQHNSDLCQACRDGECDQVNSGNSTIYLNGLVHASLSSPVSPGSPPSSDTSSHGDKRSPKYRICDSPPNQLTAKSDSVSASVDTLPLLSDSNNNKVATVPASNVIKSTRKIGQESGNENNPISSSPGVLTAPLKTANSQFFYHPAPVNSFMSAGITSYYPQAVYPLYMQCPVLNPVPNRSSDIARITELVSSTSIREDKQKDKLDTKANRKNSGDKNLNEAS